MIQQQTGERRDICENRHGDNAQSEAAQRGSRKAQQLARAMGNCAPGDRMKRFVRRAKESGWTPVNWGVTDAA